MLLEAVSGHSHGMPCSVLPPRVFLADPSDLVRGRVASMLGAGGMSIVGEAQTPQCSIDGILNGRPQVVVLDVHLSGGSGLEVIRAVRQAAPEVRFVVFSNDAGAGYRKRYLAEGAHSFLDKTSEFDQLVLAVSAASTQGRECCSK
jgi:DNA-binding NarL/FixJ family response regulator